MARRAKTSPRQAFLVRVAALALEYADEAEHQEGEGYWEEHGPLPELVTDFGIYLQALEGD